MDDDDNKHQDQTGIVWANPGWVQGRGDFLHANNALFYFAESDFFDRSSENYGLFSQFAGTPYEGEYFGTRRKFEAKLKDRAGVSFVVVQDPMDPTPTLVEAPDRSKHPSNVWVIRKQRRLHKGDDDSKLEILAYYYISNMVIFQAPTLAKILSHRFLNIADSINKMFSEAQQYPLFSVSHGHTYTKPVQKSLAPKDLGASQQSKENTPMPGQEGPGADKPVDGLELQKGGSDEDSHTLFQAMRMTSMYRDQYSDETPLVGEPGNFRFDKKASQGLKAGSGVPGAPTLAGGSRIGSPTPSRAPSIVPSGR